MSEENWAHLSGFLEVLMRFAVPLLTGILSSWLLDLAKNASNYLDRLPAGVKQAIVTVIASVLGSVAAYFGGGFGGVAELNAVGGTAVAIGAKAGRSATESVVVAESAKRSAVSAVKTANKASNVAAGADETAEEAIQIAEDKPPGMPFPIPPRRRK